MSSVSIQFNPATDSQQSVMAIVAALYGGSVIGTTLLTQGATVLPGTNPAGADADDAGPTAATVDAAGNAIRDKAGITWDPTIHSTPAKLTTKEVWRAKRGVDPLLVASVEAAQRAAVAAGTAATAATTATAAAATAIQLPATPGAIAMPALPATPVTVTPYASFVDFASKLLKTAANPTGPINEQWLSETLKVFGIASGEVAALQTATPELIAAIRKGIADACGVQDL